MVSLGLGLVGLVRRTPGDPEISVVELSALEDWGFVRK